MAFGGRVPLGLDVLLEVSMRNILKVVDNFKKDEEGAALVEYTVLLGIMLVAVIAIIITVGTWVKNKWTTLQTALATA